MLLMVLASITSQNCSEFDDGSIREADVLDKSSQEIREIID